jgi:hypothetical protein
MSQNKAAADPLAVPILTRTQVAEQLISHLSGQISAAKLSSWAFDHFYQLELEAEQLEPGHEELLEYVLDELMFGDDPHFQIDESGLRALVTRLGEV